MSKANKIELKLIFDTAALKEGMVAFFEQYQNELPMFLKEALGRTGINSDPAVVLTDDGIIFKSVNTNKGPVIVYENDKKNSFKTIDYKLVPEGESYILYEKGALGVYYKRGGAADDAVHAFQTLPHALEGMKEVPDPIEVQKRIEEIDARDKGRNDEVMAEVAAIHAGVETEELNVPQDEGLEVEAEEVK